jgi:hypothetical protein
MPTSFSAADIARFRASLGKPDDNGCIPWLGTQDGRYCQFWGRKTKIKAHRAAYEMAHGPIPTGLVVCHECDNTKCVNVDHLFLGTQADNVADMMRKGRGNKARGESQWCAKLTEKDVLAIIGRLDNGEGNASIARDYDVTRATIRFIKIGRTWSSVTNRTEETL